MFRLMGVYTLLYVQPEMAYKSRNMSLKFLDKWSCVRVYLITLFTLSIRSKHNGGTLSKILSSTSELQVGIWFRDLANYVSGCWN
jgi:hypothetical protein